MAGRDSDPLGFFGHRSLFCMLDVIRTALFDSIFDVGHDLEVNLWLEIFFNEMELRYVLEEPVASKGGI